jgi:hypothetical protein
LKIERHSLRAIWASSVIAVGPAIMLHELAHLFAGVLAGGSPSLLTAVELQGDFSGLTQVGYVILGASGSLANAMLLLAGAWFMTYQDLSPDAALTAWFVFSVNGMLLTTKLIGETLAGFGDWNTVVSHLPGSITLRLILFGVGIAGVIWMVRSSGRLLAGQLPAGSPAKRAAAAKRIVLVGASASAVLVTGAAIRAPQGMTQAVLLALAAGLGPFVPMYFTHRVVARRPEAGSGDFAVGGWTWILSAVICTLVLWLAFGPGIAL